MGRPRNKFHGKGIADQRRIARQQESERQRALSQMDLERKEAGLPAWQPARPHRSPYQERKRAELGLPPAPILPNRPRLVELSDLPPIQLPATHELPPPGPNPPVYQLPAAQALAQALGLPQIPASLPPVASPPPQPVIYEYCPSCGGPVAGFMGDDCPDCGRYLR